MTSLRTYLRRRAEREDAREAGRFAQSLAAEAFRRPGLTRDEVLSAQRDHDRVFAAWRDFEGFMDGYMEGRV